MLGAASVSAYSENQEQEQESYQNSNLQARGQDDTQTGSGQGQGQQGAGGSGYRGGRNEDWTAGSGNNAATQVSIHGTLTDIGLGTVTFTPDDGHTITVNVDPAAYGVIVNVGDGVTVSGNWLDKTIFNPMHVTLDTTTTTLREHLTFNAR